MADTIGRITFPGNPWPRGHALKEVVWSARFVPESGIWFDFHLESEDYDAEDAAKEADDEEPDDVADWVSKIVWNNYHSCILSSTYWAEEAEGSDSGVLVGTEEQPLDLRVPLDLGCDTDPGDPNDWPRPFAIYLLGHDAVADHRFAIRPHSDHRTFAIEWTGRLALIYAGADTFEHEFRALIPNARFRGIRLPNVLDRNTAIAGACRCLDHPGDFETSDHDGSTWLRLKG